MKKILSHPFVLSLIIIIGIVLINNQGWLKPIKNFSYYLIKPGQNLSYQVSFKINNFFDFVGSINQLEEENRQVKQENQEFLSQLAQLREIDQENKFLREQLDLPDTKKGQLILADIIGQDSADLRRYFLINRGSKDGIKEKAVVITSGNLLIGQVFEVNGSFSKIQVITDANSRVNALIQETGTTGLVKGENGLNLIIDLLPQGQEIKENQLVVTSGLAGLFPAGLLIGRIAKVVSSDVQISQIAELRPVVEFERLTKVFVIK